VKKKPIALGMDIFAGLFTYGVKQAGFEILGHLEHTTYGTQTAKLNFPGMLIRNGRHTWNEKEFTGKVDFMYGNPPCAAWSSNRGGDLNSWREHTDRLRIIDDLVEVGIVVKPKVWVIESVTNAWRHGREFLLAMAMRWVQAGYHVTVLLQNNRHIGGTQNRNRVFLIAHKHPLVWPPFTKAKDVRELFATLKGVKDLPHPVHYASAPPSLKKIWEEAKRFNGKLRLAMSAMYPGGDAPSPRPAFAATRLVKDRPPNVFLGGTRLTWHPDQPRHITWPEALVLNGLPMTWKTSQRGQTSAELELSRAVLPGVGKWLGTAVLNGLKQPALRGRPIIKLVSFEKPDQVYEEPIWSFEEPPFAPFELPPPAAPKPVKPGVTPRAPRIPGKPGSGARIRKLLEAGKGTAEILATVHKEFPQSKATTSDVSWNRRKIRQLKGEL
jgi:site-specific DNA-cytosine methylase